MAQHKAAGARRAPPVRAPFVRVPDVANWYRRRLSKPRRWRWLIVPVCAGVGLTAGVLWALFAPVTYTAIGYAFVALTPRSGDDPNFQDPFIGGKFALQRTATYASLATSTDVLQGVAADMHRDVITLRSQIQATAIPDRVILRLSVTDSDPQAATQIANSVITNLGRTVGALELGGTGSLELGNEPHIATSAPVQIVPVQPALLSGRSPRRYKALAGLLVGMTIGSGAFYVTRPRRETREQPSAPSQPTVTAKARG
jgi:capsular polysaccharide biosynthesis protein